jgi:hypothetical protein
MIRITEQSIQHVLRRAVVAMLMVGMNAAGLSAVGETFGYYNDTESSDGNVFAAHMLDFRLEPDPTDSWRGNGTRTITVADEGTSLVFDYTPYADNFYDNTTGFCDTLTLDVLHATTTVYSGALKDFNPEDVVASSTDAADWEFELTTSTSLPGDICTFDFIYDGWQEEMLGYDQGGYYDTEMVGNTIQASSRILITKVYFHPASGEGGYNGEWVELYNDGANDIDISGWSICDGYTCDTLPSGSTVPADGFAIIIGDQSQVPEHWHIPEDFVVITLSQQKIGNGLNDDGDMLALVRPTVGTSTIAVDQVNWGEVDEDGWDEHLLLYGSGVWNPGVSMSGEEAGDILARVPADTDTDTSADWEYVERPVIESFTYETDSHQDGDKDGDNGEQRVWYSGKPDGYVVDWTVSNPNSSMDNPFTALYLIKDTNSTGGDGGKIDTGDTSTVVSTSTDLTGSWTFTDSGGFLGYVWVRLVTTLPVNPMANVFEDSEKIYDPEYCAVFPEECAQSGPILVEEMSSDPVALSATYTDITYVGPSEPTPHMEIIGNNPAIVSLGSTYSDMNARAYNINGDDISVHADGAIDTSVAGIYEIIYTAEADGYTLTGTRLVVVYEGDKPDAALYEVPEIEIVSDIVEEESPAPVEEESSPEAGDNSGGDSDSAGAETGAADDDGATAPKNNEGNEEGDASESESDETPNSEESGSDEDLNPAETESGEDNTDIGEETPSDEDEGDGANESDDSASESSNPGGTVVDPTDELSDEGDAINKVEDDTSAGADEESTNTDEEQGDASSNNEPPAKEEDPAPAETQDEEMNEEPAPEEPKQEEAPAEETEDDSSDDSSGTEAPDDGAGLSDNGEVNA